MIGGRRLNPDAFSEAAEALRTLGRRMQRLYPKAERVGPQFDELEVLNKLLPYNTGRYIDIGASWSKECSNSWPFYERGWDGLLIEPLQETWASLLADRPRDKLCPFACSDVDGFAQMRVCRSMSSLKEEWPIDATEVVPVRTMTLESILERYPGFRAPQLLSVDVEGMEAAVFRGIDWITFTPSVIVVEWCSPDGTDTSQEWRPILEANDYESVFKNQLNEIFKLK